MPPAAPPSSPPELPELIPKKSASVRRRAPRRPPAAKTVTKELRTIYAEPDGKLPDLSRLQVRRERRLRRILIVAAVFFALAAAAAWAGFLVFKPFGSFQGSGVEFSYEGPAELVAGEEASVVIRYANRERVPLGSVEIMVVPPAGFEIVRSEPVSPAGRRWQVGNLASKASGSITVVGRVLAPIGSEVAMQTFASYVPGNFNSEFRSVGTYRATVARSVVEPVLTAPERVAQGDSFVWKIDIKNSGLQPLDGMEVRAAYPPEFLASASESVGEDNRRRFKLGTLDAGGTASVSVTGTFSGEARGAKDLIATIGRQVGEEPFAAFAVATSTIAVTGGELKTALLVNGSAEVQPLNFGDTLRISIVYKNEGSESLRDAEFALSFEPRPVQGETHLIDWTTLEDGSRGVRERNRIRWTRRSIGALRSLAPGAEGTIDLAVTLRDRPFTLDDRLYRIGLTLESKIGAIGAEQSGRTVRNAALDFPVNSDAALAASARYYNDDEIAVGTGPLPPKVGETTTFRIFWKVTNSLHELGNLGVIATLPDGVNWTNRTNASAGTVAYDPAARRVIWSLNRLPDSVPEITADFEISVIPSAAQAGVVLNLLDRSTLDADDIIAGSHLTRSSPPLDSTLEGDPVASGKGTVVQ